MPFNDQFSEHASRYAAYRPTYPSGMIDWIAALAPNRRLAWDCGTGNGQAAVLFAESFDAVIATDASAEQLRVATPHPRVEYRVANECDARIADATADLVTVAQALHWFDLPRFYAEADRVLVPGGVLAVWCYLKPRIDASIDEIIDWFHYERVGPFWPAERRHVDAEYRTLPFPYPELASQKWAIEQRMTREAFAGYVSTWSAVRQARLLEGRDPMPEFEARLNVAWHDGSVPRDVVWPLVLRAGRRA